MSLQIWLPLIEDTHNQGLNNIQFTNNGAILDPDGKLGKCYKMEAPLSYHGFSFPSSNYSVFIWAKFTEFQTSANQYIVTLNNTGATFQLMISAYGIDTDNANIRVISTSNKYATEDVLTVNTWYHIGYTYDGSIAKIYLNGQLIKTVAVTASQNMTNLTIGGRSSNSAGTTFVGNNQNLYLNDVRIYDHVLSVKEVEELSKGLVLHYKLDDPQVHSVNLLPAQYSYPILTDSGYKDTNSHDQGGPLRNIPAPPGIYTYKVFINNPSNSIVQAVLRPLRSNGNAIQTYELSNNIAAKSSGWAEVTSDFTSYTNMTQLQWGLRSTDRRDGISADPQIQYAQIEANDHATSWSIGGISTTKVYDCSGYGRNGTITGNLDVSMNTPRYNFSTDFSAGNIVTDTAPTFLKHGNFTVSFWAYSDDWSVISSSLRNVISCYAGTGRDLSGFRIYRSKNGTRLRMQYAIPNTDGFEATPYFHAANELINSQWHHFAVVFDSSSGSLVVTTFRNGQQYYQTTNTGYLFIYPEGSAKITIQAPEPNEGRFSDFRIYATALSADQIKELYDTGAAIDKDGNVYGRELVES